VVTSQSNTSVLQRAKSSEAEVGVGVSPLPADANTALPQGIVLLPLLPPRVHHCWHGQAPARQEGTGSDGRLKTLVCLKAENVGIAFILGI